MDLFFQPKYLVSNVPMRIRITRTPASFYMVNGSGTECKVQITEAVLWVRRVQVSPNVELAHTRSLHGADVKRCPDSGSWSFLKNSNWRFGGNLLEQNSV